MARIRYIKPGIMTNDDLCALGKDAYILFTGLWMLADREGRLEDRPRRIKAEAMPLWDDVTGETVDKLLESLSKAGFIHRYESDGQRYIQVTNFKKHQRPHERESPSVIPPNGANATVSMSSDEAQPRHNLGDALDDPRCLGNGEWGTGKGSGGVRKTSRSRPTVQKSSPPPRTQRKQPERAEKSVQDGPHQAPSKARAAPHTLEDVATIRASLISLAREAHLSLPPPDDGIVRKILDAGHGASGEQIHALLVGLFKREKFREMHSWGLVPILIEQWCHAA